MAKISSDDLMAAFKEMTLVELSDFVKAFETEFDVTAAAPVAAAAAGGARTGRALAGRRRACSDALLACGARRARRAARARTRGRVAEVRERRAA